jgi:branched-chain amino acid transport system substrate-binding protein
MKKILLALAFAAFACPAQADITVGLSAPLSGSVASFGEQLKHGAEQAVKDINAAGGVNGEKIKLEVFDDACDPKQAVAGANQMVSKGIKYIVGFACSGAAIPASKIILDEKLVMVVAAASNPKLTDEGGKGVVRVFGRDDKQGAVIGNLIATGFKDKKVALLNDKSAYGRGIADEVKKAMNAGNAKEVLFDSYAPGEKDYSAIVSKLKEYAIDVVYIGGYHTETGLILRQLRTAGSKAQLIGGDSLTTNEFWSITGSAGEGVLMTFAPDPRKKPYAADAVKALRASGFEPEGYTLYSYATVQVMAEALKKAGSADVAKVRDALYVNTFKTVLGDTGFDEKGDIKGAGFVIYKWSKGSYAER